MTSFCCIFCLKLKQNGHVTSTSGAADDLANEHTENKETETKSSNYGTDSGPANEKTNLTNNSEKALSKSTNGKETSDEKPSIYGQIYGWELIKLADFWLLISTLIVGSSIYKVIASNTGTYLRSFSLEADHLRIITSTSPLFLFMTKPAVGILSNLYIDKIPRIVFVIVLMALNAPLHFLFIFYAENVVLQYLINYSAVVSLGVFFVICPVLTAEYFGVQYFSINYGSIIFADGCFVLLLQFILGLLYDANVSDFATHTCYGLHCYYVSSGILCALSIVTLIATVMLCVRRDKSIYK